LTIYIFKNTQIVKFAIYIKINIIIYIITVQFVS